MVTAEAEARGGRRSLRRAVELACSVRSDLWEGERSVRIRELSLHGMLAESELVLPEGTLVIAAFVPPGSRRRVWVATEVVRVGADPDCVLATAATAKGLALAFTYCSQRDRRLLARALRGCPPPLPGRATPALVSDGSR